VNRHKAILSWNRVAPRHRGVSINVFEKPLAKPGHSLDVEQRRDLLD
jgi:hypothetical protein